jgi:tyrosinase
MDKHDRHDHPDHSEHRHNNHSLVVPAHVPAEGLGAGFTRADVVVTGVDHSGGSFEVRIFLNRPDADGSTSRDQAQGYAGRFHVFGHGGCFGDVGHCDVPAPTTDPTDLRPPHLLTPLTTYVTVTKALRQLLAEGRTLESLTFVPVSLPPARADSRPVPELFRYETVELRTYLTPLDEPVD